MIKCQLLHNPQCSKSRAAFDWLVEMDINFEIIDYLNKPLTENEVVDLCKKLSKKPFEIIRLTEQIAKKLELEKMQDQNDYYWIELLRKFPQLIERPICIVGDKSAIGRPLENIKALFRK